MLHKEKLFCSGEEEMTAELVSPAIALVVEGAFIWIEGARYKFEALFKAHNDHLCDVLLLRRADLAPYEVCFGRRLIQVRELEQLIEDERVCIGLGSSGLSYNRSLGWRRRIRRAVGIKSLKAAGRPFRPSRAVSRD